jgi:LuxR family maltose regulon positive regulatory protein
MEGLGDDIAASSLLPSKIAMPAPPPGVVARRRLFELLSAGVRKPLTLVAAPAGFGKTLLLSSWIAEARPPGYLAWVSLDADDNEAGRFWSYVQAALDRSGATAAGDAVKAPTPPAPGPLIDRLAEPEVPVTLVLDDFQEISDSGVLRGVEFLLRDAPRHLRLVIATRIDPPLPLPRLRASDLLAELRVAELAFTLSEAAELLASEGLKLSHDDLAQLHTRTEGWAAGLRLAALMLRGDPDPGARIAGFAGDDRGVADYLISEVLDRQPPAARAVLLRTAILDTMTGSLLDALTGRDDGESVLAELARTNAFVLPLEQRAWYRHHRLFAELLRAELRDQAPGEVPELHRRAADWYAGNGFVVEAMRHALAGRDWRLATALLLEHWPDLIYDEPTVLRELLTMLPPELAADDPEQALASAAGHTGAILSGTGQPGNGSRRSVPLLLTAFMLCEAWLADDVDGIAVAALEMLALLRDPGSQPSDDDRARSFALCALSAAARCTGELDAARMMLEEGMVVASRAGLERSQFDCMSQLGLLEAARGRMRDAAHAANQTLELAERHGWSRSRQASRAHLALTLVRAQWADFDGAQAHLEQATASSRGAPSVLMDGSVIIEVWLRQARGDFRGGLALLAGLRERLAGSRPPAFVERLLTVMEAGLLAASGEAKAARSLLERAQDSVEVAVARAWMELAGGSPSGAAAILAPYLKGLAPTFSLALLLQAWLLDALAARALTDDDRAFRSLERALLLAEQEGFRLAFRRAGSGCRALLAEQLGRDTAHRQLVVDLLEMLEGDPPRR